MAGSLHPTQPQKHVVGVQEDFLSMSLIARLLGSTGEGTCSSVSKEPPISPT